ncbi:hypothetical protein [Tritonibacter mobilis]|uniref:hypothetical protein n=1 Tax=Tritonibacter mobilis TaxID=379347 RepID=UPI000E0DDAFD|nr:hypothetical protein [Tritonibacter mobilis]
MTKVWAALMAMLALTGCWKETPTQANLSMTSYSYSPVLVTEAKVEGLKIPFNTKVVTGEAENANIPRNLGTYTLSWSAGNKDAVAVSAKWVELLTDRAWEASLEVSPDDLLRNSLNTASITLIFGPNGQFVAGTDPSDTGSGKDLASECGTRTPTQDRDISAEVDAHALLAEALRFDHPPVPDQTTCPEPAS